MGLQIILVSLTVPAMYICLCNGHRERDIRAVAETGLRCPRTIYRQLGGPPRCGRCLPMAKQVVDEVNASLAAPAADAS